MKMLNLCGAHDGNCVTDNHEIGKVFFTSARVANRVLVSDIGHVKNLFNTVRNKVFNGILMGSHCEHAVFNGRDKHIYSEVV